MFYPKAYSVQQKTCGYKLSTNETLTPLGATYIVVYTHQLCMYQVIVLHTTYMPHHRQGQKFPTQHIVCTYVVHLPS